MQVKFQENTFSVAYRYQRGTSDNIILLIHGLGSSKEVFQDIFQYDCFKQYSVLTIDLLGHGDSEKPTNFSYSLEDQAKIVIQILQNFSINSLFLVGHSIGVPIALFVCNYLNKKPKVFISVEGAICNEDTGQRLSLKEFIHNLNKVSNNQILRADVQRTLPLAFMKMGKSLSDSLIENVFLPILLSLSMQKRHIYSSYVNLELLHHLNKNELVKIDSSGHFIMINTRDVFYRVVYTILHNIEAGRLLAMPTATHCLKCSQKGKK